MQDDLEKISSLLSNVLDDTLVKSSGCSRNPYSCEEALYGLISHTCWLKIETRVSSILLIQLVLVKFVRCGVWESPSSQHAATFVDWPYLQCSCGCGSRQQVS